MANEDGGNAFHILIATDIHLGYEEKDPIRGDDSFVAFEEILTLAVERKVDMILLGGDLFHENKPSQRCLLKCVTLLRRYCMGDKPVQFEFLSDQSVNFGHCAFSNVNYEDPNLNVSLPVFTIHGNHDDPSVNWQVSSMHLLSATGLVNYFGWNGDLQNLEVRPLLMRKGSTLLAVYGLGSIKDERLSRLMEANKVQVFKPRSQPDEWFNVLVLHQNHVIRGTSQHSYIPEHMLPDFMNLIIWGHEHECIPELEKNLTKEFYVLQPGSSVATSLSEGEAAQKHVFLLTVRGEKKFDVEPIQLQTVRPLVFDTITLSEYDSLQPTEENINANRRQFRQQATLSKKVEEVVRDKIEDLLSNAVSLRTGHKMQPTLPLVRLRLLYNDRKQMINAVRLGNDYMEQVANPKDMILQKKETVRGGKKDRGEKGKLDEDALLQAAQLAREQQDELGDIRVETVVEKYFEQPGQMLNETVDRKSRELEVLSVKGLLECVTRYVDKEDSGSMAQACKYYVDRTVNYLKAEKVPGDDESVYEGLDRFKRSRKVDKDKESLTVFLESQNRAAGTSGRVARKGNDDVNFGEFNESSTSRKGRGAGKTRAKGHRGGRGRGKTSVLQSDDEEDDVMDESPVGGSHRNPKGRSRGRGRAAAGQSRSSRAASRNVSQAHDSSMSCVASGKSRLGYISDSDDD